MYNAMLWSDTWRTCWNEDLKYPSLKQKFNSRKLSGACSPIWTPKFVFYNTIIPCCDLLLFISRQLFKEHSFPTEHSNLLKTLWLFFMKFDLSCNWLTSPKRQFVKVLLTLWLRCFEAAVRQRCASISTKWRMTKVLNEEDSCSG